MITPEKQQENTIGPDATDPYMARIPYMADYAAERTTFDQSGEYSDIGGLPPVPPTPPETPVGYDQFPTPNRNKGRGVAIVLLSLVLAAVLGSGVFAGWEFSHGTAVVTSNITTVARSTVAATVSASTANSLDVIRESVAARLRPAVVEITGDTTGGSVIGSGVIIDKKGYIVTNNHVVADAQNFQVVLADGSKLAGQVVGTDAADDLAVLKINPAANITVAQYGNSAQLQIGQEVLAIGNPLGITQTVTHGIVSALDRTVPESNTVSIAHLIQTDAPINPGNSGGALIDLQGNLVGIPTLGAVNQESNTAANGIGFAIPANRVQTVVTQIIQQGSITQ